MKRPKTTIAHELRQLLQVLRYEGGERRNARARRAFLRWRELQDPPIPPRCDNKGCKFFTEPLIWNGKPMPLILAHQNGVNSDNRTTNLLLLCPNCDAQDTHTRGGANKGRVEKCSGGFAITERVMPKQYHLPAETGFYEHQGSEARLHGPEGVR